MTTATDALPETITAPRTDAVYNCHAYLTKVPVGAIRPFIEAFTSPGELVVDPFAGSGMTGIAAAILGRAAHLSDISALGQHIANGYLTEVSESEFRRAAEGVIGEARAALGDLYTTRRASDGESVEVVRTVWSFTYACPSCTQEMVYYEHMQRNRTASPEKCLACGTVFSKRGWIEKTDVPVEVVIRNATGRLVEQPPTDIDRTNISNANADPRLSLVPSLTIDASREMYSRSGLGKRGLTETSRFFSARNAIGLLELWFAIQRVEDQKLNRKLAFAFTAILARASRRYQWSAQRPLNAQNQTYYIAPVYYEWNIFELFERKIEASIRAAAEMQSYGPLFPKRPALNAGYTLTSANDLSHLGDQSVDYVFTDPPFGSNIFYSDMNLFHEAWLGRTTDHSSEAVMHTTGKKKGGAAVRYEELLRGAFAEAFRVLKPGRHLSVVFGNSDGRVWELVQRALRAAGFEDTPVSVTILDKGQRSVKGLKSGTENVATVDLVMTLRKPLLKAAVAMSREISQAEPQSLIQRVVTTLSTDRPQSPSQIYAAVLREAIHLRLAVDKLHLGDVLVALRNSGFVINPKTGLLSRPVRERAA